MCLVPKCHRIFNPLSIYLMYSFILFNVFLKYIFAVTLRLFITNEALSINRTCKTHLSQHRTGDSKLNSVFSICGKNVIMAI